MPTYIIPPWQSIHGFPGYSGHPRIIRGCQPIQYPLGRVSTDSPDTLDIPGLSVDSNLYNTPLTEYPRFLDTLDIPGLSVDANLYNTPLAEYQRIPRILPRTIRGCQPIQYPLDRVSTDSPDTLNIPGLSVDANLEYPRFLDTLDIPGLSVDANLYNTPLAEYPRISWILWTSPDYPWMPTYTIPLWKSIHGFPGYSGHPRTIRGCQPI